MLVVREGSFFGLRIGDEARVEAVCERRREDESAGLDADDDVNFLVDVILSERVNQHRESGPVAQQRGDVVEEDSRLGEIRNGADDFLERLAIDSWLVGHSRFVTHALSG